MKRAPHIPLTEREFRRQKRKQFRAVFKAMDALRLGSAFLPRGTCGKLTEAELLLEAALSECRKWWRNA